MAAPRATYRLQFNRDFTFRDARHLVPYLAKLGVSHIYASPVTEARPGSTHGYDVVDHNRLNPEIGDEGEFRALVAALHECGMGLILDIVPNHMGIGSGNAWWQDVLEWGEASPYAAYFDINWDAARPDLKGRVLLPVLGEQYGIALAKGEIELRFDRETGSFFIAYYEHRFPVSPFLYGRILASAVPILTELVAEFVALRGMRRETRGPASVLKRRLAEAAVYPEIYNAITASLTAWAGIPGRPASFRPLHRLLEGQAYRLAYWRVAADEINYRRFFNINDLAGLRVELPELFAETHKMVLAMARRGEIDGLRIDHIDGLFDPDSYAGELRRQLPAGSYVIAEKILAHHEKLPVWPVDGSTGYDFANQVLGLFVDPGGERAMTALYRRFTGRRADFDAVLQGSKRRIMEVNLASEMNVLAQRFHHLSMSDWGTRDFTFNAVLKALDLVVGAFPVYRTYVSPQGARPDDRRYIDWAVAQAKKQAPARDTSIFDFVHDVLLGTVPGFSRPADVLRTAMQFQQVTGPVMAKAAEDTAFYRYFRLMALNEVGGDPRRFGVSTAAFHHLMQERARDWPRTMNSTATHDTKWGEDARIRIAMLSELPREWGQQITRWRRFNRSRRREVGDEIVPDRNVEYLFYQVLVGAWPPCLEAGDVDGVKSLADRVGAYMIKALREGKEASSWSNPNELYEAAIAQFVATVLDVSRPNAFLDDFHRFLATLVRPAAISSLAQLTIKLMAPGIPDTYQGGELWDFSLVDPDNRRPPHWEQRRELLSAIETASLGDIGARWPDGREKLFLTYRLLRLRSEFPELFAQGEYIPLLAEGDYAGHVLAFARRHEGTTLVVAVPRLVCHLYRGETRHDWAATALSLPHDGPWHDLLTDNCTKSASVLVADLFARFAVAIVLSVTG